MTTREPRIRSVPCPNASVAERQSFNHLQKSIKNKISIKYTAKTRASILPYITAHQDSHLLQLISWASNNSNPSCFTFEAYDVYVLFQPEIFDIFALENIIKFKDINGRDVKMHAHQKTFLSQLKNQNYTDNIFETIQEYTVYSKAYAEELKQDEFRKQIKKIKTCIQEKRIPPKPTAISTFSEYIPSTAILLNQILIGVDVNAPDHDECGYVKFWPMTIKYDIDYDTVNGQHDILQTAFQIKEKFALKEEKKHPFYNKEDTRLIYGDERNLKSLELNVKRTEKLKFELNKLLYSHYPFYDLHYKIRSCSSDKIILTLTKPKHKMQKQRENTMEIDEME